MARERDDLLLSPGDAVDHFEVVRYLGRGGTGEVYLAVDSTLDREVALKLVHPKALGDGRTIERFIAEAKITARFSHPSIVTIFSVGEHRARPYLALEYVEGETLRQRLRASPSGLPWREAARIALAIAEALAEAHRHEVLHRDLKPENVLISTDGRVRVADFGLAERLDLRGEDGGGPRSGAAGRRDDGDPLAGTPLYIAPERWLAMPSSGAADVWSLGVVLFECLTGRPPFVAESLRDLRSEACGVEPSLVLDPTDRRPPPPAAVVGLLRRCLDKLPGGRPSAEAAAEELRALLAERVDGPLRSGAEALREGGDPAPLPPPRPAFRRASIVGLLVLGAGALAGLFAAGRDRPEAPATEATPTRAAPDSGAARAALDAGTVTVTLEGAPSGAAVFLDGRPVEGPVLRASRSTGRHELLVEMEGHLPWRRAISLARDGEVAVDLVREPEEPRPAPPGERDRRGARLGRPRGDAGPPGPAQEPLADPTFETRFHP